ncbi:hypothetical protein [Cryobacterium sp. PAMC25264]|uniref:hypothetical protein n=1 Tax=Cryobacterium sp. PAMC25264 TaxID=2861288 RepID=UPI001C631C1A|nr:hypothetical protein [Cryobacterium sp. PAMC25264]QYF72687.1 hypothetical protein KY500_12855 [Cryobacterium sp. PAMC25264]
MAESGLTVSGGAGGIGASLDDMRTESAQLSAMAQQLVDQALAAADIAVDGDLLASALLSPITAATAEEKIVFATGQMLIFATDAGVTAVFLAGAVDAYEAVDASLKILANAAVNATTLVAGVMVIPLALGAGVLVLADVAAVYAGGYVLEGLDALREGVDKTLANPASLLNPGAALVALAANTAGAYDVDDAQETVDEAFADQLEQLNALAGDNAWAVDLIAQGAPGLLAGLTLPLGLLSLGGSNWLLGKLTGMPWPPASYEQALQAIIGAGNRGGYFNDGPLLTGDDLFTPPEIVGADVVTPTSLETLFDGSAQIDQYDTSATGDENALARIRITEVPGNPPSFIVQIPSTQSWDAQAGSTPNDLTGDTHAMLAQQTALSSAVDAAMREAGIMPDDPVMLQGFSLGGITAGQMAADPTLNYNITNVVTGGAPIANFDIPSDVQVLSLEFDEDPVPKLDSNGNPESANWTTVEASAPSLSTDKGAPVGIGGETGAHNPNRYAITAGEVDASSDPSITAWGDSAAGYFPAGDDPVEVTTSTDPTTGVTTTTTTNSRTHQIVSTTTDYGAQR